MQWILVVFGGPPLCLGATSHGQVEANPGKSGVDAAI